MKNKSTIEKHIGRRLQSRRLECGLSQREVDEKIGGTKGITKAFEQGSRVIAANHLFTLSKVLNVDICFFFQDADTDADEIPQLAPASDVIAGAKRLLDAYYSIQDPDLRRKVADLFRNVANSE